MNYSVSYKVQKLKIIKEKEPRLVFWLLRYDKKRRRANRVSLLSFAAETKQELTQLEVQYDYSKYELAALIRMNGAVGILNRQLILNIQTENAAIARRIYILLKKYYQVESELLVRRKMKLKKNNVYIVRLKHGTEEILEDLNQIERIIQYARSGKH